MVSLIVASALYAGKQILIFSFIFNFELISKD